MTLPGSGNARRRTRVHHGARGAPRKVPVRDTGRCSRTGTAIRASPSAVGRVRNGGRDHGAFIAAATGFPAIVFTAALRRGRPLLAAVALGAADAHGARPPSRPLPCALRRPVARRVPVTFAFSLFVAVGWLISFCASCCCPFGSGRRPGRVVVLIGTVYVSWRTTKLLVAPAPPVPRRTRAVPLDFVGTDLHHPHRTGGSRVRTGRGQGGGRSAAVVRSGRRATTPSRVAAPDCSTLTTRPAISSGSRPTTARSTRGPAGQDGIGHQLRPPASSLISAR